MSAAGLADHRAWWQQLTAAALVGTSRREPPPLPAAIRGRRADEPETDRETDAGPPPEGPTDRQARRAPDRETTILDAAALAGTLRRAGRRPTTGAATTGEGGTPAPPDARPVAPDRAVQLLQLILDQPPVDRTLRPALVAAWLHAATEAGRRAPHPLLPRLLERATAEPSLRPAAAPVADARGAWLAGLNPRWSWLADGPGAEVTVDPDAWARSSTADRAVAVRRLRRTDPAAARALVASTWSTDPAADRASLLAALEPGLGPADEELLERALDDRANAVRQRAYELLDALPGSARARRMADRLRPLLHPRGRLRRTLEIELPTTPDAAGTRDGLVKPLPGRSERGSWLEQLAAAAPFDVWTEATGRDPESTVPMIGDTDALAGLRRAALARRDPEWAAALLAATGDVDLLAVLPREQRERAAAALVLRAQPTRIVRLLESLPPPWTPATSSAVVERLRTLEPALPQLRPVLAAGLHPAVRPQLERWARGKHAWGDVPDDLVQLLSLIPAITEAFRP